MSDELDRAEAFQKAYEIAMAELAIKQGRSEQAIGNLFVAIDHTEAVVTKLAEIVYSACGYQKDQGQHPPRLEDLL